MKYEIKGSRLTLDKILEFHKEHDWIWVPDGRRGPVVLIQLYKGKARYRPITMYASVYLEPSFLRTLIDKALQNVGSMRRLVNEIWGGKRQSSSYAFNNIFSGKYGIPITRLKSLCDLANVSLSEADKHVLKIRTRSKYAFEIYSKKRGGAIIEDLEEVARSE